MVIGGSERIGYLIDGEPCNTLNTAPSKWRGNTVHSVLHGVNILTNQGIPRCTMISGFLVWKAYDWGVFFFPTSRVIVKDIVLADNVNSINGLVYEPKALTHKTADKFIHIQDTVLIGRTASWDCTIDAVEPAATVVNEFQRAHRSTTGKGHFPLQPF